jgi:hypothetical protein
VTVEDKKEEEQPVFHHIRTKHVHDSHTTHTSSPSSQTPDTSAEEDSTKTFFIALGLFIVIIGAIFLIPRFFSEEPQTLTEIHQENLNEQKDTATEYVYNGYSFVYYDGLWYTQIYNQFAEELYNVPLHFAPKNLTDIVITGDINPFFGGILSSNISNSSARYYLTFSPNDPALGYVALASGELSQNLVTTFNIAPVSACTEEGTGCETVPLITCDATDQPVIYLKSGSPTLIYANGNCITIQGEGAELVRAVDRFLLKLYNVMI